MDQSLVRGYPIASFYKNVYKTPDLVSGHSNSYRRTSNDSGGPFPPRAQFLRELYYLWFLPPHLLGPLIEKSHNLHLFLPDKLVRLLVDHMVFVSDFSACENNQVSYPYALLLIQVI